MEEQTTAEKYVGAGDRLYEDGTFQEACADYERAVQIKPDYAPAYSGWGNALLGLKRFDEALDKFQKATDLDPNNGAASLTGVSPSVVSNDMTRPLRSSREPRR